MNRLFDQISHSVISCVFVSVLLTITKFISWRQPTTKFIPFIARNLWNDCFLVPNNFLSASTVKLLQFQIKLEITWCSTFASKVNVTPKVVKFSEKLQLTAALCNEIWLMLLWARKFVTAKIDFSFEMGKSTPLGVLIILLAIIPFP